MADKNMDDLLAQLQAEFEPIKQPKSNSERSPSQKPNSKASESPNNPKSQASMDKMLSDLRNELESGRARGEAISSPSEPHSALNQPAANSQTKNAQDKDRLIAAIEREYQKQAQQREQKLAAIKRQEEELLAQQERQARELIAAQQKAETREKRRKEALKQKAQEWLKKLNPQSEEGKWFEEFSYSYESKLIAAIDYLEAMRESGL